MAQPPHDRRETRLLLVTIAVSIGMLLLLARFRFPRESTATLEVSSAPLERLAARATYDELAAIMADLERRITPAVAVLEIERERGGRGFLAAPRLAPDRVVILLGAGDQLATGTAGGPIVIGRDATRELAVVATGRGDGPLVVPRTGPLRPGPRYVAVVEGARGGPAVRPVYIGRTELFQDPRLSTPMLSVAALQQTLTRGAAVFALDGQFVGLASDVSGTVTIVPAEELRLFAEGAHDVPAQPGDLGIDVQPLTPALARASGAERGVMVSHVRERGPAAGVLTSADVIQAMDGTGVSTVGGFQQLVAARPPGKAVTLDVVRQGKPIQLTVRAVEAAALSAATPTDDDPGLTLRVVGSLGLEVVALQPETAAAKADVRVGDIVLAVDAMPARDADRVREAYRRASSGSAVLLTIRRGTEHRVIALEKP